jgi:hypothetical protein
VNDENERTDWIPRPDPTLLTNQLVQQAVAGLREILEARLDGMDIALELSQENLRQVPTEIEKEIRHLTDLLERELKVVDEKFGSVQTQFAERDTRVEQTSRDSKLAIDAALQAAKEAVGKSETSTIKQIDGQGLRIDDLKERLTRIESEGRGQKIAETTQQTSNAGTVGMIGLVAGTLIGLGGLVAALMR